MVAGPVIRAALDAVGARTGQIRTDAVLAAGATDALRQAPPGLTVSGAASFLATQAQESDYFRTTEEYNAEDADYAPYWGATFEQVTWKTNYGAFGQWCHDRKLVGDPQIFVRDPKALTAYEWAWLGGVWFFERFGLWRYANAGDHYAVSQGVNRGPNSIGTPATPRHWPARLAMFEAFRAAGTALLPPPPADTAPLRRRRTLLIN